MTLIKDGLSGSVRLRNQLFGIVGGPEELAALEPIDEFRL